MIFKNYRTKQEDIDNSFYITYIIADETIIAKSCIGDILVSSNIFKSKLLRYHFLKLINPLDPEQRLSFAKIMSTYSRVNLEVYSYKHFLANPYNAKDLPAAYAKEEKLLKYITLKILDTAMKDSFVNFLEGYSASASIYYNTIVELDSFETQIRYEINLHKRNISSLLNTLEKKLQIKYPINLFANSQLSLEQLQLLSKFFPIEEYKGNTLNFRQFLFLISNKNLSKYLTLEKFKFIFEETFLLLRFLNLIIIYGERDGNLNSVYVKKLCIALKKQFLGDAALPFTIPFKWSGESISNTLQDKLYNLLEVTNRSIFEEVILNLHMESFKDLSEYLNK